MTKTKPFDQDARPVISSRTPAPRSSRGTRQHDRVVRDFDAPGASRRFWAGVGGIATVATLALMIGNRVSNNYDNDYLVDVDKISTMSPEDIASQYDVIIAGNDGNGIDFLAEQYMDRHDLSGVETRYDIKTSLEAQARLHDEAAGQEADGIVNPGDTFYLRR